MKIDLQVFSVYDSAADAFLQPFFAPTVEFAVREFRRAVNEEGHQFNQYPDDYTLFHIGEFDQSSGALAGAAPRSLGIAITMMDYTDSYYVQEEVNSEEHADS